MRFSTIISCFITVLAAGHTTAQDAGEANNDRYRAVHWGVDEGLGVDRWHNAMLKDVNGFLWIGSTQGELSRFDGSSFQQFMPDKNKPGTIRNNSCISFVEDSLHNIWIGTGKGLSRYDIRADTFTNFMAFIDTGTFREGVIPFWATQNEIFCLESGSQIITYDINSFKRKILLNIVPEDKMKIDFTVSYAIYDAGSNSVWMLAMNEEGLVQLSLSSAKTIFHKRKSNKKTPDASGHTDAEAMCYDRKRNCIWINSHDGLFQFTLDDHQFHPVEAMNSLTRLKNYDRWVGIDIDSQGRIWLATTPKGLIIYNPASGSVAEPFSDTALQKEVATGNLKIYCDRDGLVWTSFWNLKEIYQLIPYSPSVRRHAANAADPDSLSSSQIVNILDAGDGHLWIGTEDGLNIYDSKNGSFKVLREKDLPGIKGNIIVPMVIDTIRKKAWINAGPNDWVYEVDMQTKKCTPLIFKDISNQAVSTHNIINTISAPVKNGIIFFDALHGLFEVNTDSLVARQVIALQSYVLRMFVEDGRKLFLSTPGRPTNLTYNKTNGKWIKTPHPLDSLFWTDMVYDKTDQTYWVAIPNQLMHFDKDFHEIRRYTDERGMMARILTILPDRKGNIWFNNARKIIASLNPKTGIITALSESDGYHKQSYDFSTVQGKEINGEMYFAGSTLAPGKIGLDRVNPDKREISPPSSVYLKSLKINQQSFPLSTGVNNLQELSLRYFQNKISIETGIINYYSKGKSFIRYKLDAEGKNDAGWEYGPDHYTIRYEELQPGKYKLVVQAANAANVFNGPEKTLLIHISPPFWNTWWFRSMVLLLAAALLYSFIRYRSRRLKERNLLLEKKVMQRTNELNDSLAELKTTQDQLIQSEKMASLGELTSGIAHEIKNPLNFVNNFSEINTELITEIEEELIPNPDENNLAQMASIVKTLKKNLEKINHHGKRIDGIVKGMLQHSRLGNVKKELVDINALCDESLKLAWHGFRAKEKTFNASFEARFDPELPQVSVFPQDFGRVMINLISNAFYTVHEKKKCSQSESLPATLQTESLYKPLVIVSTKKNGNKICITVSDNGMGIPSQIINKIFQPFFTTKPTGEGTGLGLSMSYDIISKSHGGEIKAKSKEGLGTDFEIILPIS